MPFDFTNFKPYTFSYDSLFNSLKEAPFLRNQSLKEQYLEYWIALLKKHDQMITEAFNTPQKILEHKRKIFEFNETEIFQQEFTFLPDIKVYFHYRISVIFKMLLETQNMNSSITYTLKEFTDKNSTIKWTKRNVNKNRPFNTTPVFLVPFLDGPYSYTLIDGNHRISHAIKLNIKEIQAFPFGEKSVIESQIFCSSFDLYLYIFNNEINHFANNKEFKNVSDEELLRKSYLTGNGFQF